MVCPNCGHEIENGHLICEKCGYEICIVPDFEPEIENSIYETLNEMIEDGFETSDKDEKKSFSDLSDKDEKESFSDLSFLNDKKVLRITVISAIATLVVVLAAVIIIVSLNTVDSQINKARKYYKNCQYEEAISVLTQASSKTSNNSELILLEAECYAMLEDHSSAIHLLDRIISGGNFSGEEKELAYEMTIELYKEDSCIQEINELLKNCNDSVLRDKYHEFLADMPKFSIEPGNYDKVIALELSAESDGIIYYTLNNSVPSEYSNVYESPISMQSGEYVINAIFVNSYGIVSDVATAEYNIALDIPDMPEVPLSSGEFYTPQTIEVSCQDNCEIYYTTDKSNPNTESTLYTGPIAMPLGTTLFKFVCISGDGVPSDITMRTYTLKMNGASSSKSALNNLINHLVEIGYISDIYGARPSGGGEYKYHHGSVMEVEGISYYAIDEYIDNGDGNETLTGKTFLVDAYNADIFALLTDDGAGNIYADPI